MTDGDTAAWPSALWVGQVMTQEHYRCSRRALWIGRNAPPPPSADSRGTSESVRQPHPGAHLCPRQLAQPVSGDPLWADPARALTRAR